jgi:hypothetical protein
VIHRGLRVVVVVVVVAAAAAAVVVVVVVVVELHGGGGLWWLQAMPRALSVVTGGDAGSVYVYTIDNAL